MMVCWLSGIKQDTSKLSKPTNIVSSMVDLLYHLSYSHLQQSFLTAPKFQVTDQLSKLQNPSFDFLKSTWKMDLTLWL